MSSGLTSEARVPIDIWHARRLSAYCRRLTRFTSKGLLRWDDTLLLSGFSKDASARFKLQGCSGQRAHYARVCYFIRSGTLCSSGLLISTGTIGSIGLLKCVDTLRAIDFSLYARHAPFFWYAIHTQTRFPGEVCSRLSARCLLHGLLMHEAR